jgi:hypothetical protein
MAFRLALIQVKWIEGSSFNHSSTIKLDEMPSEVTFLRMPRSKPKTSAEGQEQLSTSLARMASAPVASRRVPITEIGFAQCRFVVDDRNFPALCCGEPTLGGSWCAQHRALVFVRVAAPNHRKPAQEPPKAPPAPAVAGPNGPAKRPEAQAAAPTAAKRPPPSDTQKLASRAIAVVADKGTPAKPPITVTAKKDGAGAIQRAAQSPKETAKISAKGEGKQGKQAKPAKKPEPSGKSAAAKPSAKKAPPAPTRKGSAARTKVSVKKAAGRKSISAKRPAPAKKAAVSRSAAKRPLSAKKSVATRKSPTARSKAKASAKSSRSKRKTR